MNKLLILPLTLLIFLGVLPLCFAQTHTITQISGSGQGGESAQINDNGNVVWWGDEGPIFFYNGTTHQLTVSDDIYSPPVINNNDQVVWSAYDYSDEDGAIFSWDGLTPATPTITQVTTTAYPAQELQINNNGQLVWYGGAGGVSNNYEIYFWNGTGPHQLTDDSLGDHEPKINNDGQVVWSKFVFPNLEICFWDGTDITQITQYTGVNLSKQYQQINNNGEVVWCGGHHNGGNEDIYFWDGLDPLNPAIISLGMEGNGMPYYPQINNNGEVVWYMHEYDLDPDSEEDDYEIYLWNGSTITQITANDFADGGGLELGPRINDNGDIVWIAEEAIVYFYDASTGITTALTDGSMESWGLQMNNNGDIVWSSYDEETEETNIFLASRNQGEGEGVIPEPASLLLLGMGVTGLAFFRKRGYKVE